MQILVNSPILIKQIEMYFRTISKSLNQKLCVIVLYPGIFEFYFIKTSILYNKGVLKNQFTDYVVKEKEKKHSALVIHIPDQVVAVYPPNS